MAKIKVIHILHSVGGVDVSLRLITENLDASQFESIVVHGTTDTEKKFLNKKGDLLMEYRLPISREINFFSDLKSVVGAARILRKERPHVIHAHSAKGGVIARLATIFYPVKVLHTPQAYSYLSVPNGLKKNVFLFIERMLKYRNSVLVASSNSERNRGIKEVGYKPENTRLFNNSINPIEKSTLHLGGIKLPKDFICTVGRPSFQKNIEMMIVVLKKLKQKDPAVHLIIMGVGEYSPNKDNVERLIKEYGLEDNITLIPWIEREKIFAIIDKAKVYISTARYEGLPYSIIESLALGKSCVVTNCDGNRDLVVDGYNGYVVEENSVDTMANRIFALLQDAELRQSFETNAFSHFNANFNIEQSIHKLESIYKENSK
jgi:glycosyltransferase involved in cell wall biosynthesis